MRINALLVSFLLLAIGLVYLHPNSTQPALGSDSVALKTNITGLNDDVLATEGIDQSAQSLADFILDAGELGYPVESELLGVTCYYVEDAAMLDLNGALVGFGKLVDIQTIESKPVIVGIHLQPYTPSGVDYEVTGYDSQVYRNGYDQLVSEVLSEYDRSLVKECDVSVPYYIFGADYRRTVLEDADGDRIVVEYISLDDQSSMFSLSCYGKHHMYLAGTAVSAGPPSWHTW